ncbi:MAG: FHA domain-containing protein [Eubacterium sp.]|nr:FHA domain-containing protein [Eubacterium sp.]
MNLKTCPNGHFYDADVFVACPHCSNLKPANSGAAPQAPAVIGDETSAAFAQPVADNISYNENTQAPLYDEVNSNAQHVDYDEHVTISIDPSRRDEQAFQPVSAQPAFESETIDEDEKTVRYFDAIHSEPVAGWLVCIDSVQNVGADFKLKVGMNYIGRNEQDVRIEGDLAVSRRKHAVVVYEPKKNVFYVDRGESQQLTYLNGSVVLAPTELSANDVIQVGRTKLMFIPFCSDKFRWDDILLKEDNNG